MVELKCVIMEFGAPCVEMAGVCQIYNSKYCASVINSSWTKHLPIVYSDVACAGWETHLLECSRKQHSTFECSSSNSDGM